jgi:hypothetical protein
MDEIIQLLNNSNDFDFIVMNADNSGNYTSSDIVFNSATQKKEITIIFDNNYLETATKLSIARTFLHESIHAYLLYIDTIMSDGIIDGLINYGLDNGIPLGVVHHNFMAQYVDAIGYSLNKWNSTFGGPTNISRSYFDDIAWGGLSAKSVNPSTGILTWWESFELIIDSESERNRIHNNIINEYLNNDSAKSDPC